MCSSDAHMLDADLRGAGGLRAVAVNVPAASARRGPVSIGPQVGPYCGTTMQSGVGALYPESTVLLYVCVCMFFSLPERHGVGTKGTFDDKRWSSPSNEDSNRLQTP